MTWNVVDVNDTAPFNYFYCSWAERLGSNIEVFFTSMLKTALIGNFSYIKRTKSTTATHHRTHTYLKGKNEMEVKEDHNR